jgi:hypothetical protein
MRKVKSATGIDPYITALTISCTIYASPLLAQYTQL